MQELRLEPELEKRQMLADLVRSAKPVLEDAIGPPATRVKAMWGFRADEQGQPRLRLTLEDWSGRASAEFAPEELASPDHARRRFYRLWGDLLQDASFRLSQELETIGTDGQG